MLVISMNSRLLKLTTKEKMLFLVGEKLLKQKELPILILYYTHIALPLLFVLLGFTSLSVLKNIQVASPPPITPESPPR